MSTKDRVGVFVVVLLVVAWVAWRMSSNTSGQTAAVQGTRQATAETSIRTPGPSVVPSTLSQVHFRTTGWTPEETSENRLSWTNADGDALSIDRAGGLVPGPFADDASVQAFARREFGGAKRGLVSAGLARLSGVSAAKILYKRDERPAYGYTGIVIIPGDGLYFMIVVASIERGITGARDALVTALLGREGKIDIKKTDANHRLLGWFRDPYDARLDAEALNSVADDEQYDSLVPFHPLTKVRATLREIEASLSFSR